MGKPAARIGDMHVCPMVTGIVPHVGGPVIGPGVPTVLIGKMPAAVMGDMVTCVGPPDTILLGSSGVFIGGKPAARMGDTCAHGGTIILGCMTVLIGETGSGGGGAGGGGGGGGGSVSNAGNTGEEPKKVVDALNNQSLAEAAAAGDGLAPKATEETLTVQFTLVDDAGKEVAGVDYEIETSDGKIHSGKTDGGGKTAVITGYTPSQCRPRFKH